MNIIVLNNLGRLKCRPINNRFILGIKKNIDKTDDMYVIDLENDEKIELAPDLEKYDLNHIRYASAEINYLIFSTLDKDEESDSKLISYHKVDIMANELTNLHTIKVPCNEFDKSVFVKLFVLDEYHYLSQFEYVDKATGKSSYRYELFNLETGLTTPVDIPILTESGIHKMTPLPNNQILLKIGKPVLAQSIHSTIVLKDYKEYIGITNINEFISVLSINMSNEFMNILDKKTGDETFPLIRFNGKQIYYSIYHMNDYRAEIKMYDLETGKTSVRIFSRISRIDDLKNIFIIDGNPYLLAKSSTRHSKVIDLNTQKALIKLDAEDSIEYVREDLVVMIKKKRKKFGPKQEYIEIYRFPDIYQNPVLSIKAEYAGVIVIGDDLILLTK